MLAMAKLGKYSRGKVCQRLRRDLMLPTLSYKRHADQQLSDALREEIFLAANLAITDHHFMFFSKLNEQAMAFGEDLQAALENRANIVISDQVLGYL
jgi:uncharacterized membrane protein YebE (DUF533 family)